MQVLKEIHEKDVGIPKTDGSNNKERKAGRTVLSASDGKVAILHVANKGYYKIPGGGR